MYVCVFIDDGGAGVVLVTQSFLEWGERGPPSGPRTSPWLIRPLVFTYKGRV